MIEDIKAVIFGGAIIALIISLFSYFGSKGKIGDNTFIQKFIKIYIIILLISLLGAILDKAGCSSDEDPDYPMKYQPD